MNISFSMARLVPRFIYHDKNGYALCKAIEKCFQRVAAGVQTGLDIIQDPDKMPEWRLDELAGEMNCMYDYKGSLESKRYWIRDAIRLSTMYGTAQGIINFLEGTFQTVEVEEAWEYGGDPFHFRVIVSNPKYDAQKIAWAQKAIEGVKNVRSVLDTITIDSSSEIVITADTDFFYVENLFPGEEQYTNANDIGDWEEIPVDPAKTDEGLTDEGVTG